MDVYVEDADPDDIIQKSSFSWNCVFQRCRLRRGDALAPPAVVALATAARQVVWVVDFDDDKECAHLAALPATVRATLAVTAQCRPRHFRLNQVVPAAQLAAARGVGWFCVDHYISDGVMSSRRDIIDLAPLAECRGVILVLCSAISNFLPLRKVPAVTIEHCFGFEDLGALDGVQELKVELTHTAVYNVSALHGLRRLNLFDLDLHAMPRSLADDDNNHQAHMLQALGSASELWLAHCRCLDQATFVQALGGVQRLVLCGFEALTDVSALGRVPILEFEDCTSMLDVSALGSVHTLTIRRCDVVNLAALGSVHSLSLEEVYVLDVSVLATVHTLSLHGCLSVRDVSALGAVHTLDLTGCKNVEDVSALGGVHVLNLSGCKKVTTVFALRGVFTLNLEGCTGVRDVQAVAGVAVLLGLVNLGGLLWSEGKLERAVELYRMAAARNDADAEFYLGVSYDTGQGVEHDFVEATAWYFRAAEHGHGASQYNTGIVEQDATKAAMWFRKAARQGIDDAQFKLGSCFAHGKGVEQDAAEAAVWYRRAAGQGHAKAQYKLGTCYANGEGVKQDAVEAVKWYRFAACKGAFAQAALGRCYDMGAGVTQDAAKAAWLYAQACPEYDQILAAGQRAAAVVQGSLPVKGAGWALSRITSQHVTVASHEHTLSLTPKRRPAKCSVCNAVVPEVPSAYFPCTLEDADCRFALCGHCFERAILPSLPPSGVKHPSTTRHES